MGVCVWAQLIWGNPQMPQNTGVLVGKMGLTAMVLAPHRLRTVVSFYFKDSQAVSSWAILKVCAGFHVMGGFFFIHLPVVKNCKKWFMSSPVCGDHEDLKWHFFFFWSSLRKRQTNVVNNNNNVIPGRKESSSLPWLVLEFENSWEGWLLCNRVSFRLSSLKRLGMGGGR